MKKITFLLLLIVFPFLINAQNYTELTAGGTSPLSSVDTNFEIGDTRTSFSIDYDADGDDDIISINASNNAWHLLRNDGTGSFAVETGTTIGLSIANPVNFIVMDYDNDGDQDIIDPVKGADTQAAIFRNDGGTFVELTAGGTSPLSSLDTNFEVGGISTSFSIDYDVDGDEDIISINSAISAWHLLRNDGTGSFIVETGTTIGLSIANTANFFVMDYDNDGDQDIIDPVKGTNTQAAIFRNDGGTFVELTAGGTSPLSSVDTNFEIGDTRTSFSIDYDVDGDEDIISINSANTAWHLLRNDGSGSFAVETGTTIGLSIINPENFFIIDYDNDDDQDIVDTPKGIDTDAAIFSNNNAPPTIMSSMPVDDSTGFDSSENIEIIFNESINKGTGNIEIRRVNDNSVVETIDVVITNVSGSVLTINPTSNLITGVDLYIHIAPGAITDADGEIPVSLNNNSQTLNFTAENTLRVDDSLLKNSINIYPNPVNNKLFVNSTNLQIQEAVIYDVLGKAIRNIEVKGINMIDFSSINIGLYLLKLKTNQGTFTKRIIKE
ncbi:FG-GAP-like repeat-containing protein [Algibacter sp. AS12]|uniref:FG-GAP-like repeat-containing protein n=1 Tax=Algibacter sp. AS12 TaxID=3135773 RepID=UPI00398B4BB8